MTCTSKGFLFSRSVVNFRSVRFNAYAHPSNRPTTRCTFEKPTSRDAPQVDEIGAKARHRGQLRGARAVKSSTRARLVSRRVVPPAEGTRFSRTAETSPREVNDSSLPPRGSVRDFSARENHPAIDDLGENRGGWLAALCVPVAPCGGISNQNGPFYFSSATARTATSPLENSLYSPPSSPYAPYASN